MASPPATPPTTFSHERFIDTGDDCEWAEEYRPGGYHPVSLGDAFSDGKYKVIQKLGDGSFSTVWLAINSGMPKYVALKIMTANASAKSTELEIFDHLSKMAEGDPNAKHLTVLLDSFVHQGPNGEHLCLVFEPMAVTAASLVEELPENRPRMRGKPRRYPKRIAKRLLLHALRGLDFLHRNGVVHGDVQPGNLLFSMKDLSSVDENELKQDEETTAVPLHRKDGKTDRWAPENLYLKESLHEYVELGPELCVKVSDLGAAFWLADPPQDTVTPLALRAPELILHQPMPIGCGIDTWSFGCLMFEFLTGQMLFPVMLYGNSQKAKYNADDGHLIALNDIIGPLPDSVMAAWPRSGDWYGPDRERIDTQGAGGKPYIHESLEIRFAKYKPADIDDTESSIVCDLIRQILAYAPAKRPSTTDLLKHPWFSEDDVADGDDAKEAEGSTEEEVNGDKEEEATLN